MRSRLAGAKLRTMGTIVNKDNSIGGAIRRLVGAGLRLRGSHRGLLLDTKMSGGCLGPRCAYRVYGSGNCASNGVYSYEARLLGGFTDRRLSCGAPLGLSDFRSFDLSCCPARGCNGNVSPHREVGKMCRFYHRCTTSFDARSPGLFVCKRANLNGARLSLTVTGRIVGGNFDMMCSSTRGLFAQLRGRHFNERNNGARSAILCYSLLVLSSLNTRFSAGCILSRVCGVVGDHVSCNEPAMVDSGTTLSRLAKLCNTEIASEVVKSCRLVLFRNESIHRVGGHLSG